LKVRQAVGLLVGRLVIKNIINEFKYIYIYMYIYIYLQKLNPNTDQFNP